MSAKVLGEGGERAGHAELRELCAGRCRGGTGDCVFQTTPGGVVLYEGQSVGTG